MTALVSIRHLVSRFMLALLWLHLPLIGATALLLGVDWIGPVAGAALFAVLATAAWRFDRDGAVARPVMGVALVMMVSLLVFVFSGHPWQIDLHMYFFAALAVLAAFCDWRTLLVAAGAVALHHLALNFLLPLAVFPQGADFGRVVLHAVIVVLETAVLVWLTARLVGALTTSEAATDQARKAEAEALRAGEEKRAAEQQAMLEKQAALRALSDEFEASVGRMVEAVSTQAQGMRQRAEQVSGVAGQAGTRSVAAAERAQQAMQNVQTVASATEELSASIGEIAQQVGQSSRIAGEAAERARGTDGTVQALAEAAQKIGDVVDLIQDIAEQTNLLALNATIEAARAGEAGKGFAVVASEVKNLANQTSQATGEIAQQIGAIQSASRDTVEAIAAIRRTIEEINEVATAISAAVEEQSAAVGEISRNTAAAADGTTQVSGEIEQVRLASGQTVEVAGENGTAAGELQGLVGRLGGEVEGFLRRVRAG